MNVVYSTTITIEFRYPVITFTIRSILMLECWLLMYLNKLWANII